MVGQNEDLVAIDAELVGWGNGVRYGRGTNAAHYSRAGHQCGAAAAVAPTAADTTFRRLENTPLA